VIISRLLRDRKDGVMGKVGIIDYSMGGAFRGGRGSERRRER
jgi:hypothetical protein